MLYHKPNLLKSLKITSRPYITLANMPKQDNNNTDTYVYQFYLYKTIYTIFTKQLCYGDGLVFIFYKQQDRSNANNNSCLK